MAEKNATKGYRPPALKVDEEYDYDASTTHTGGFHSTASTTTVSDVGLNAVTTTTPVSNSAWGMQQVQHYQYQPPPPHTALPYPYHPPPPPPPRLHLGSTRPAVPPEAATADDEEEEEYQPDGENYAEEYEQGEEEQYEEEFVDDFGEENGEYEEEEQQHIMYQDGEEDGPAYDDYGEEGPEDDQDGVAGHYPPEQPSDSWNHPPQQVDGVDPQAMDGEEALLDLSQLEELHQEAERMKALGNKHMAAQEYTRAYNAYSAALQLSPVGPSSHVFLSNRAASLLSLKRYAAAATDARRAIALAPTFGKAHARLGQALYFLKDYKAAVAAYQDALQYEPDNAVTQTYLEKARTKMEKQARRASASVSGEVSLAGESSTQQTIINSIATENTQDRQAVVTTGYRGNVAAMQAVAARAASQYRAGPASSSASQPAPTVPDEDPEFEEALRIQLRANKYLSRKQYKAAIEEYTAALFLVPDDPNLSPDLHLGRAHALNGSRRHESARNDANMAIRIKPSPAAYSTLAKSLFYLRDYRGSINAFKQCTALLPPGEPLGMFDRAYLQKAEAALDEEEASLRKAGKIAPHQPKSPVPRLPPPRFVPREEAIQSTPNVPRMPKQWPTQTPHAPSTLQVGPEREVVFLSESLGIKLNRGPDGVVRVLSVTPNTPSSAVARTGQIEVGDVIREACGVDIRRPITNIMWGDTVALIKMATRPIVMVVAQELSAVPHSVLEEQRKVAGAPSTPTNGVQERVVRPSPALGGDDMSSTVAKLLEDHQVSPSASDQTTSDVQVGDVNHAASTVADTDHVASPLDTHCPTPTLDISADAPATVQEQLPRESQSTCIDANRQSEESEGSVPLNASKLDNAVERDRLEDAAPASKAGESESLRDVEERVVRGEMLFVRDSPPAYNGWDSLRWLSYSGARRVSYCQSVHRLVESDRIQMFWKSKEKRYVEMALVIYEEPSVILLVRRPRSLEEIFSILDLPDNTAIEEPEIAMGSYWVVESVADPATCKLHLSSLTTPTSQCREGADERERSCFALIHPGDYIQLSAVRIRKKFKNVEMSFSDSGAYLETVAAETAISRALTRYHENFGDIGKPLVDISWKHQIVVGNLHSLVLSGNQNALEAAIAKLRVSAEVNREGKIQPLTERIVDPVDDNDLTPLYYACSRRMSGAVGLLVNAGARLDIRVEPRLFTLMHICAASLDDKSLSMILSGTNPSRPNPNAVDATGLTPMYIASTEGLTSGGTRDAAALGRCIMALEAWGGKMFADDGREIRHPVTSLASAWLSNQAEVVLQHLPFRFPLQDVDGATNQKSLNATYQFPIHEALLSLKRRPLPGSVDDLIRTLQVLVSHGFELNERVDSKAALGELTAFGGFAPFQMLCSIALEREASEQLETSPEYQHVVSCMENAALFLVRHGARVGLDPPTDTRLIRKPAQSCSLSVSSVEESDQKPRLKDPVGALRLIGGKVRLDEARKEWLTLPAVSFISTTSLLRDDNATFEDSEEPGGSSELSCAICWKHFGTLRFRRHKCRVTRRYVCDDCSSKRLLESGREYRVSDGQYWLSCADVERHLNRSVNRNVQKEIQLEKVRDERLAAEQRSSRESLFGGVIDQASNYIFGDEPTPRSQGIDSVKTSLGEARDALNLRGEKLTDLGHKSAQLVDASANFAQMAKELRRKSEQGLFW